MIDLHSHTTFSDGEHTPEELLALARQAGVTVLAVTDHDDVSGLARAQLAATREGLTLVPGIEISAELNRREVHVLGHFVNPEAPRLQELGAALRQERLTRMQGMVARLQGLGYPVTMEEVLERAGSAILARPHLAHVLVERGYCLTLREAFDRFLGAGRPGYVDRHRMSSAEAIARIRDAGGAATLAHPGVSKVEQHDLAELAGAGLAGLEVFHGDHVPSQREKYLQLAARFGLIPTGGSDFHGPKVTPGRLLGAERTPPENFERLRARAA